MCAVLEEHKAKKQPPPVPISGPELAAMMKTGTRVVRGVDWKWGDQVSPHMKEKNNWPFYITIIFAPCNHFQFLKTFLCNKRIFTFEFSLVIKLNIFLNSLYLMKVCIVIRFYKFLTHLTTKIGI